VIDTRKKLMWRLGGGLQAPKRHLNLFHCFVRKSSGVWVSLNTGLRRTYTLPQPRVEDRSGILGKANRMLSMTIRWRAEGNMKDSFN